MPLVQFRDKYSGNINAVLTEDIDARIAASKVRCWATTSSRAWTRIMSPVLQRAPKHINTAQGDAYAAPAFQPNDTRDLKTMLAIQSPADWIQLKH